MKIDKLLMIPGPTPVARSIQDQMGRPTVAFGDPDFVKDFKSVIEDMKEMWSAEEAFVIAGSGSLSMEIAIANTLQEGERLLVVSNGHFGDRFVEIAGRKGIEVDAIYSEWGQTVSVDEIEEKLKSGKYDGITVTHVDTSTGVKAPIAEIGAMLKREFPDIIYIVDGVCSTAAEPENVKDMNIDVLFSGSQKAFGVAPGLALVWASQKALDKRDSMGHIPEYYADFHRWLPIMNDPSKYFGTPPVNLIWALRESLNIIQEEGLQGRFDRHEKQARAIQKALEALGFELLAQEGIRAVTLSNPLYFGDIDDAEFRAVLAEEGVVVAGGLGDYAGKMFRIGHMGNIDKHTIVSVLSAIERALHRLGVDVEFGRAAGVFMEETE